MIGIAKNKGYSSFPARDQWHRDISIPARSYDFVRKAQHLLSVREVFHQIYVLDNDSPKKTVSLWSIMDLEHSNEQEFLRNWTARLSASTGTTAYSGESHNTSLTYNTNRDSCFMVRYYYDKYSGIVGSERKTHWIILFLVITKFTWDKTRTRFSFVSVIEFLLNLLV